MKNVVFASPLSASIAIAVAFACAPDPCGTPLYAGAGSDEAYVTFVQNEGNVQIDDAKAPWIIEPAEGTTYPSGAGAPVVRWTVAGMMSSVEPTRPARQGTRSKSFAELFIGTAWAHQPPITGDAFIVRFEAEGRACKIELVTTETSWSFDPAAFDALRGENVRTTIFRLPLIRGFYSEGPFAPGAPRHFSIAR